MADIAPDLQEKLITIVYDYLHGTSIHTICARIKTSCNTSGYGAKYLFLHTTMDTHLFQALLNTLNVPLENQADYQQKEPLFVLLQRLHQDGYGYAHLEYLLKQINETHPRRFWLRVAIGAGITGSIGGYFIYTKQHPLLWLYRMGEILFPDFALDWLKKSVTLLENIPIMGVIYYSALLLWKLRETFYYGFANFNKKINTTLFSLLGKGSTICAYVITILSAGVATPFVGLLFVFSAMVDIVESIIDYISIIKKPFPWQENLTENQQADKIRLENQKLLASNSLLIKVSAAILTSVAVAVWCFCPITFPLLVAIIASMIAISFAKSMLLSYVEKNHSIQLQSNLNKFFTKSPQLTPNPAHSSRFFTQPLVSSDEISSDDLQMRYQ